MDIPMQNFYQIEHSYIMECKQIEDQYIVVACKGVTLVLEGDFLLIQNMSNNKYKAYFLDLLDNIEDLNYIVDNYQYLSLENAKNVFPEWDLDVYNYGN